MGKKILLCIPMAMRSIPRATYNSFHRCYEYLYNNLDLLPFKVDAIGRYPCTTFPIDANRNETVAYALKEGFDYTIWFDFDQTFPEDMCIKLLQHDLPIVTGMYFGKSTPYHPIIFNCVNEDKREFKHFRPLVEFPESELFYADMIGMGCVAIKTEVFKALEQPFFKYQEHPRETIAKDWEFRVENKINDVSEDVWFWKEVRQKTDYKIVVDPSIQCGHLSEIEIGKEIFMGYLEGSKQAYVEKYGMDKFKEKWAGICRAETVKKKL